MERLKGRARNVSSLVLKFSYEWKPWKLWKAMKSIYCKTGTRTSDNVAPHKWEILEQTSHRKATAGKDLIEGMNEVLFFKEQGNEPSLPGLFFFKMWDSLYRGKWISSQMDQNQQRFRETFFFPMSLSNDSKGLTLIETTSVCLRSDEGIKLKQ